MDIKIRLDVNNNAETPTICLNNRNHNFIGNIPESFITDINFGNNTNSAKELSFTVHKNQVSSDNKEISVCPYWDQIVNFKLIYVPEYDRYFEIKVSLNDDIEVIKNITATSQSESELSQVMLYGIEINTETDIERSDYVLPTVVYRSLSTLVVGSDEYNELKGSSLLHRILEKAPHYSIQYVAPSIMNIQRTFSVDGTSICEFLTSTLSDEINCFVEFDDKNRTISVYDLYSKCNTCGYRGDFDTVCPECQSLDVVNGYGEDTKVFVSKENLASSISFETNTDEIKNCFKLTAGDDLMTATIKNLNPNGSDYLYYFSDDIKSDMSAELKTKLDDYDALYNSYKESYTNIISNIYDLIDDILYYTSEMMPSIESDTSTSVTEAAKLSLANLSPLGLEKVTLSTSLATVNAALENYAKVYVKSGKFKVKVNTGDFDYTGTDAEEYNYGMWEGNFIVTNYSDEEDTTISETIRIKVYNNYADFLKQKIEKVINSADDSNTDSDGSIFNVLSIDDLTEFTNALKTTCNTCNYQGDFRDTCPECQSTDIKVGYALNRLISFHDALQSVIDIMIQVDQANETADLYEAMYLPYYNKMVAVQTEIDLRSATIDALNQASDSYNTQQTEIQNALNFETYLGEELWLEFYAYRREDKYENSNYISDGLTNKELFEKAQEFLDVCEKDIYKSANEQHTLSASLNNLLVLKEFASLRDKFVCGNFIRVECDEIVYKLRLLSYKINYGSIQNIEVTFSDVIKVQNRLNDVKSIIKQASSMATSYSNVQQQASQGAKSIDMLYNWIENGLNASVVKIVNSAENQSVVMDSHGLLARTYDDISDTYGDEQLKIINSTLAITTDNWKSIKAAIGKYKYIHPETGEEVTAYGTIGETIVGKLLLGEALGIYNTENTMKFDKDGLAIENDTNKIVINPNGDLFCISKFVNGVEVKQIYIDQSGDMIFDWSGGLAPSIDDISGLTDALATASANSKSYQVVLSNENQSIVTDSDGVTTDTFIISSDIDTYKGIDKIASAISTVLFKDSNGNVITTGINTSHINATALLSGSVTVTISSNINLPADYGYIEVNITIEETEFTKKISWNKSKAGTDGIIGVDGIQGETGEQGLPGKDGVDGVSSYTHIAYSTSPTGSTGFSTTNSLNATYIGMYVDSNINDSTTPSDYNWTLVKGADGTQGVPGLAGSNGLTPYLHIAYATASDGSTGFSTTVATGKTYIGTYTDYVSADSEVYSNYTWALIKGSDGKGISSVTEYYAVSTSSTVAPTIWYTTVQTMTETNKYLWNYENVVYTDSTTYDSLKRVIGVYGATGSSGSAGVGITSVVNYYLATASSTGVTTSTSGWTTAVQSVTSTNKYLWNYEVITFTNATNTTSTPCIIGAYGDTGTTGSAGRTYALDCSTLAIKKGADNVLAPTTVTFSSFYRDGTSATRTAYSGRFIISESTDGSTFNAVYTSSSNESSKVYTPSGSTIKAIKCVMYAAGGTTTALDTQTVVILTDVSNIDVNEVNLLRNSGYFINSNYWINDSATDWSLEVVEGILKATKLTITTGKWIRGTLSEALVSANYTVTFKIRTSLSKTNIPIYFGVKDSSASAISIGSFTTVGNTWKVVTLTLNNTSTILNQIFLSSSDFSTIGETVEFEFIKVQKGNVYTGWSLNPLDLTSALNVNSSSITDVQQSISNLLVTNGDLSTQIGGCVTADDLTTYKSIVDAAIASGTASAIATSSNNLVDATKTLNEKLEKAESDQRNYIRFDDGIIYLGEISNNVKLLIENDAITFYVGNDPVATFTNSALDVPRATIDDLSIGNFIFKPRGNGNLSISRI